MKQLKGAQRERPRLDEPCGDFYPDGAWNPRAEHRGALFGFVGQLCRACRAAPLAINPAVIARRVADSQFSGAFPNREQWAGINPNTYAWLEAVVGSSAEAAVRSSASWWRRPEDGVPSGIPISGQPTADEMAELIRKRDAAPWQSIPEMTWVGDLLLPKGASKLTIGEG